MDAGLWLDYHQRTSAASRWSSTGLNSANTAADSPDTPERQIVGGKRRSMNRSDIRMREYLCRRLSAARRRQNYEPGFRVFLYGSHVTTPRCSKCAETEETTRRAMAMPRRCYYALGDPTACITAFCIFPGRRTDSVRTKLWCDRPLRTAKLQLNQCQRNWDALTCNINIYLIIERQ